MEILSFSIYFQHFSLYVSWQLKQDDIIESPTPVGITGQALTEQENREIVTPYAFKVCPNLYGVPLATPLRRLLAISLDGVIVMGLAGASLFAIVPFIAYLVWRRWQAAAKKHLIMLAVAALFLVPTAHFAPEYIQETEENAPAGTELDTQAALAFAAFSFRVTAEDCDKNCMDSAFSEIVREFAKQKVSRQQTESMITDVLNQTDYPESQRPQLIQTIFKDYPEVETKAVQAQAQAASTLQTKAKPWYQPSPETHSVIQWVQGIFADLGIGVGWMIAYFTLCVAWGNGQTLGKWLFGIQVIQVDGQGLSLFNSFSRQGGYGAGFATGMLGFLQIFWDPNRQAIQDKVSNTVVIRLGQPKRPLTH